MTGWGDGLLSIPTDANAAAAGRRMLALPTPTFDDDRLRRATRECALAIAAVEQVLHHSALSPSDLAGPRTAVVYASASSYAAANWAFLQADTNNAVYFPYTAPSAVPGEVTIYLSTTGPYLSLLSGANAGIEALWQAATLLGRDQCDRALILGVETFAECTDLYTAGRWLLHTPLVETALCLILERHPALANISYTAGSGEDELAMMDAVLDNPATTAVALCMPRLKDGYHTAQRIRERWPAISVTLVNERTGTCLAATPLIGLLLAHAEAQREQILCMSRWGEDWSMLRWPLR